MPIRQPFNGFANPRGPAPFNNVNGNAALPDLATLITRRPSLGFPAAPNMFANQIQPQPNMFPPNFVPLPNQFQPQLHQQQYNFQNMGVPNQLQNMNSATPMQMPLQFGPFNIPSGNFQMAGPQNANLLANALLALSQQNIAIPTLLYGVNGSNPLPLATQQVLQGNASVPNQPPHSTQPPPSFVQNQKLVKSPVPLVQGDQVNHGQIGNQKSNWKTNHTKDFKHHNRSSGSQTGYQNSQLRHNNNKKRKFGFANEEKGKGLDNKQISDFGHLDQTLQGSGKKRYLALPYTEQEIKHWREQRRKNYPSKANIEKKQNEELKDSEVHDREAKLRREQLKGILMKQAELGVEVAEIPQQYLSDSEKTVHREKNGRRPFNKKGRFQNRYQKGERPNRFAQRGKHQNLSEQDPSRDSTLTKRQPTLLQKLLSADITRDKHQLLQVFRFFVLNSFLKDWPMKPLKFPLVVVREDGLENSSFEQQDATALSNGMPAQRLSALGRDDDDEEEEDVNEVEQGSFSRGKGRVLIEEVDAGIEEEGEITD